MNSNPFSFSHPVAGQDFYNRRDEIETAIGFIRNLQCFSVVGERRIGKTSFLRHLLSEEVLKEYGIDPKNYILVYLDIGSLHEITKNKFIGAIIEKTREKYQIEIESLDPFEKFEIYVERLVTERKNLVIVLDEFECIASILDNYLSYWLRFIFQRPCVMAITASQKTVAELGEFGSSASPLFNIFANFFLKLFRREEAEKMIVEMFLKGGIELDEHEISFLADLSGGNPFFIQLIGSIYFEERRHKNVEQIETDFLRKEAFRQGKEHFNQYWKNLAAKERKFLMGIMEKQYDIDSYTEHDLERRGLLIKKEGKVLFFSPLFGEFVRERIEENKSKLEEPAEGVKLQKETDTPYEYDVFICHASEDKAPFVRKLAEELSEKGLRVWYDEFALDLGDNLIHKIDYGLARSRYGIIVLSKNFFNKDWAQRELDALVARESETKKVILPIWHEVTIKEVQRFSPLLASRLAVSSDKGIDYVVNEIINVVKKK